MKNILFEKQSSNNQLKKFVVHLRGSGPLDRQDPYHLGSVYRAHRRERDSAHVPQRLHAPANPHEHHDDARAGSRLRAPILRAVLRDARRHIERRPRAWATILRTRVHQRLAADQP